MAKATVDDSVSLQPIVHHRVNMLDLLTSYNKLKRKKRRIESGEHMESNFIEQTARGEKHAKKYIRRHQNNYTFDWEESDKQQQI